MVGIRSPPERGCGRLRYEGSVVDILYIGKTLIPCARVLEIIHVQDMHEHSIYDLGLAIYLWVEGCGFGELGV
jgi:hypothetical protein